MPSVIVHIANEDPVVGEIDSIPATNDTIIIIKNPRRKDGKDIPFLDQNVSTVVWPMHRVQFIELMPTGEEDEIISFVRE
jgi:hypothetical protein